MVEMSENFIQNSNYICVIIVIIYYNIIKSILITFYILFLFFYNMIEGLTKLTFFTNTGMIYVVAGAQ